MTEKEWLQLKNGTDVRGTAIDGGSDDPVTLTDEAVWALPKRFAFGCKKRRVQIIPSLQSVTIHAFPPIGFRVRSRKGSPLAEATSS